MKKSLQFVIFLLSFIGGVVIAKFITVTFVAWIIGLLLVGLILLIKQKVLILFIILGLALGWIRWNFSQELTNSNHISVYAEQTVHIKVVVTNEVERRIDRQKITVRVEEIFLSGSWKPVGGKMLVTTSLYPEFFYGDRLIIRGKIQRPESFTYLTETGRTIEFAYDDYLSRYDIYALSFYPEIELMEKDQGSWLIRVILDFKESVIAKVNNFLPEPQSSFLGGLLWGAKRALDPELMLLFNRTGTTHIVALSGFNITIIGVLVFLVSPWLYLNRRQAYWLALTIIALFIIFTGAQASVLRAGIMGGLALTAYYLGRPKQIFNLLVTAAFLMVLINPLILFFDIGFQLSFLATIGLVYLTPGLEKYLKFLPTKLAIRESATATMAAIIMTGPLIAFEFGRISLIAPLTNILILPFIPLAMFFGFLMVIASFINYYLALVASVITWLFLSYIIYIVKFFGSLPHIELQTNFKSSLWLVIFYLLLASLIIWPNRQALLRVVKYLK